MGFLTPSGFGMTSGGGINATAIILLFLHDSLRKFLAVFSSHLYHVNA